jgi:glycosyltransferase involved in cell wall biosynthesis
MPLVTVVIPTYNRLDILKETLDSVFCQSFSDFEVLVIDGGSTESLDPLIQQFEDRVTFIHRPYTSLPSVTRNFGIKKASGRYIAFLDSDDLWLSEKLRTQVQVFLDHPEIGLVCSDAYILNPCTKEKPNRPYLNDRNEKTGFLLDDLINNNFIITSTCIVRRDVFNKTGGFSENPVFRGIEDYELWLRIAQQYQIHYIPVPLAVYRDSENSLRSEISLMHYYDSLDLLYTTLQSELLKTNQCAFTCNRLDRKIYENNVGKLRLFLSIGDKIHFKSLLMNMIVTHPLLVPKLFARITKTYLRQMKTNIKKTERI